MTRARALAVWAALGSFLAAFPAAGQSPEGDETLLRTGIELRRAGRDQDALELFRAAYRFRPTARALAQIGFAEQALGRWTDAARDIEEAGRNTQDPWIEKNTEQLSQALANVERHLGRLQVLGTPVGATVTVDEQQVGKLPMPAAVRVNAGEVVISVGAPGHISITRKVSIEVGTTTRETIVLHATEAPGPVAVPPPAAIVAPPPAAPAPAPPPASPGRWVRRAAWATAAAGVVALAAGVLENASYLSKRDDFNRGVAPGPCGTSLTNRGQAGCAGLYDDMQGAKTLAIVGFGVAGAAAIGSAILFVTAARYPDEQPHLACGVGVTSVGCRISF